MKDRRFELRLSEAEYRKLAVLAACDPDCRAGRSGKPSLSAYIRNHIIRARDQPEKRMEEMKSLCYQVRKAGVNINQVARRVNAGLWDGRELKEILAGQQRIEELLDRILCLVSDQAGEPEEGRDADGYYQDAAH